MLYSTYCTVDMYGGCCTVDMYGGCCTVHTVQWTCTVDVVQYGQVQWMLYSTLLYSGHVQWTRTMNMNGGHVPSSLLTVDEEIVEEEELSLLSVPCRDLYE